jgi:hypothetical protein
MIIYLVTNKLNGKKYVGQTKQTLSYRWHKHMKRGNALFNAIRKYGGSNFTIEEVCKCDSNKELCKMEKYWIKKLNTMYPSGYNLTTGGELKKEYSLTTIEKLRLSHLGHKPTPETLKRMSEAQKIAQLKPELVEVKRKRMLGNKLTLGVSPWNKGKSWDEETKKKISESKKGCLGTWLGRHHTEVSKKLISEHSWIKGHPERHPMIGKHHAPESIEKMRIAREGKHLVMGQLI